ncbi:hypothetical protein MMC25_004157 [Agyrium rufum]|nr:hypothetical protein [Agyrium rufum]
MMGSESPIYVPIDEERSRQSDDFLDEKFERRTQPRSTSRRLVTAFIILGGLLLVVIIGGLFHINYQIELVVRQQAGHQLIKSPIPNLPLEVNVFDAPGIYSEPPNEASNLAWEALAGPIVPQQGFIAVEDSASYDLRPSAKFHGNEVYGISMFHQLHCLGGIRKVVWQLLDGTLDREEFFALDGDASSPDFVPNGRGVWHMRHCFNYIRQGLQCAGDVSLERPTYFNGTPIVVGWGNPHTCKSWDAAWKYIEDHPAHVPPSE